MEYCENCNSLMSPQKEGDEKYLVCRNCGKKVKLGDEEFKVKKKHGEREEDIVVIDEKARKEADALPVTEKTCPECGHEKAAWWTQQTRSGDEAPTRFYKCKKCGHRWREYG